MKILPGSITCLAGEGRLTIQVPTISIGTDDRALEDAPDDWFVLTGYGTKPAIGRERSSAFVYLSRKGYEANKSALRAAFNQSTSRRGTWQQFEAAAEAFFADLEKNRQKRIARLTQQIKDLEAYQV